MKPTARATKSAGEPLPLPPGCVASGLVLLCLLALLAVSNQSFWIDEALTGLKARQPTLAGWWQQMIAERHSDLQMPLYMFYSWGWARLFGTGEWALRAANLPWFVAGLLAFASSFRGWSRLFAPAIATLSSFAWFYLDEARPYAMQLGAGLMITGAVRQLLAWDDTTERRQAGWGRILCLGLGVLAGSSLLGVVWCGAAVLVLVLVLGWQGVVSICRRNWPVWGMLGVWMGGLALYYAWTLHVGARASAAATTNWQSAFFVVYELMGFNGLGPGRLEIRAAGLNAFRPFVLPLAAHGVFLTGLLVLGWLAAWRRERRGFLSVALIVPVTLVGLLAAGWLMHFRLLGRHCAPAYAVVALWIVAGADEARQRRSCWSQVILCGLLLATLASCLSARFAGRHQKDDYRAAAAYARAALEDGRRVWWSADPHGAAFYGLPLSETAAAGRAEWVVNPAAATLDSRSLPDVVVCSKPDLYDVSGVLAARMKVEGFRKAGGFSAFNIWTAGDGQAETSFNE